MRWLQKPSGKLAKANKHQRTAMYIAKVVRNAMEEFHAENLSDTCPCGRCKGEQMAELNPIIRNAIYTALYAKDRKVDLRARMFVAHINLTIPEYRELPKLIDEFADDKPSDQT